MSVTSTMYTGVSGLLNQAEAMNVIGNNIANVNTIGFKGARTLFSDVLSRNIGNNSQIGYGVQLQVIDNLFSQGSFESTANVTDLAIQGNSFFAVKDPNALAPVAQNSALFTRSGAFRLNSSLTLINPDGYEVLDTQGNAIKFSDNAAAIETITGALTSQCTAPANAIDVQAIAQSTAASAFQTSILTASALTYTTQSALIAAAAATFQGVAGGTATEAAAQQAILTAANAAVTAAAAATADPTSINLNTAAQSAFNQLNSLVNNSTFTTTAVDTGFNAFKSSLAASNTIIASEAPPAQITASINIKNAATAAQTASATAVAAPTPVTLAAAQKAFNDFSSLTNRTNFTSATFIPIYSPFQAGVATANTNVDVAVATAAPSIETAKAQLAAAQGVAFNKITSINPSGLITYLGKDGATLNFYNVSGQIGIPASTTNAVGVQRLAVMSVTNPGGLEKAGGTLYKATTASGVPTAGFDLKTNTANGSSEKIYTNNLEQSNVDMASEFVRMIVTQRAYSANSKTITTSDEMTQEVLNLKR